jgi:hypothetical protein
MKAVDKVCEIINNFIGPANRGIFSHKPKGPEEMCHVCHKSMSAGITQVGSGERMHAKCWSTFFSNRVEQLKEKYGPSDKRPGR